MNQATLLSYLRHLTKPFFAAWWMALTGFASVVALFVTPSAGVVLGGVAVASLLLVAFALGFLVLSVVSQGWRAWATRSDVRVVGIERVGTGAEGWLLVIESRADMSIGAVFDVYRRSGSIEAPFAICQITEKTSTGAYQASPIGSVNPSHLRELKAASLRPTDLVVREFVEMRRLRTIAHELSQQVDDDGR